MDVAGNGSDRFLKIMNGHFDAGNDKLARVAYLLYIVFLDCASGYVIVINKVITNY